MRTDSNAVAVVQRYDVVDGTGRVLLSGTSPTSLGPALGERLPDGVAERVAGLIRHHDFIAQPVAMFLLDARLVRVVRVSGLADAHFGVWSERVSLRRLLAGAARHYGLTPLEVATLGSIAAGLHTLEIADRTKRTVPEILADIASLKRKMACTTRQTLVERMFPSITTAVGDVAQHA